MNKEINRFINAQNGLFYGVLSELGSGHKKTHWIWYFFPQLKGLGHSYNSEYYGIDDLNEAKTYWSNDVLRTRYLMLCNILLRNNDDIENIMGDLDSIKLHSSLTLFYLLSKNPIISKVLNKFYGGSLDNNTLELLKQEINYEKNKFN